MRSYSELVKFDTFKDRFRYLKLGDAVGESTFGFDRYLNQIFYRSPEWRRIRDYVIARDEGCDLGLLGFEIHGKLYIHHMNPISKGQILDRADELLDPEYLITVSHKTHNMIHYGVDEVYVNEPITRKSGDTRLW